LRGCSGNSAAIFPRGFERAEHEPNPTARGGLMATDIESIGSSEPNLADSIKMIGVGAVNVKVHFGATGDGSTDDTLAIQAALDYDTLTTNGVWNGINGDAEAGAGVDYTGARGGVYFPPGSYKITSALTIYGTAPDYVQSMGRIFGDPGAVKIFGDFAGYLIDNPNPGPEAPNNHLGIIEGIIFVNENSAGGCIRYYSNYSTHIRNCWFKGHHGVLMGGGSDVHVAFDSTVENCRFISLTATEGTWDSGSIGLGIGYNCRARDNSFVLWDTAVVMWGGQAACYNTRIEVCNVGIWHGIEPDLSTANTNSAGVIENIAFESCRYDIKLRSADGLSIRDILGQGNQDSLHDSQASFYYEANGNAVNVVVTNYKTTGTWDLGGYYFVNGPSAAHPEITFIGCQGDFDANGQNMAACEQYHCWFGQFSGTFANRPTYVNVGSRRIFTDAEVKTSGAALAQTDVGVTAIQGTGAKTVEAVYNGTDWILTAILA
jgi:hypothetical protein